MEPYNVDQIIGRCHKHKVIPSLKLLKRSKVNISNGS